jgi:hypothetical protein
MLQKLLCALVVLGLCVGLTLAEEIRAVVIKVDGNKVTFAEYKGKGEKGAEKTLPAAANVKVVKGVINKDTKKLDAGEALSGGLKSDQLSKIGEKGLRATVITDADNKTITEIRVAPEFRKKPNN